MKPNRKAFTLIELLVVVLIIGILAAVALPQYQMAVAKSRAIQAITMLRAIINAQEAYFLANGEYTTNLDELDVDVPLELRSANDNNDSQYWFECWDSGQTCGARIPNKDLPMFESRLQHQKEHPKWNGRSWCRCNGDKTIKAEKICKTLGTPEPASMTTACFYLLNK